MKGEGHFSIGTLLTISVLVLITACGGGGSSSSGSAPQSSTTKVTVNISQSRSATVQALPEEIARIRITITGPGMTTVTEEVPVSGQQSIQKLFDLPNGSGRCFLAEAFDAAGKLIYRGDVYADLNGIALVIDLTIVGNDATPPSFGGITDITAVSSGSITLSWTAATDNVTSPDKIQYLIYGTTAKGTENYDPPNFVTGPGATTFAATGLVSDMNYCFVVRAKDEAGNIETNTVEKCARTSASSSGNSSGGAQNDTLAPTAPSNLTAAPAGMNRVNLAWEPSSDNYSVTGYKVYRDGTYITTVTSTSWVTVINSYADPGLTSNTQYCYAVSAIDSSNNESARTVPACATTSASFFTLSTNSICENNTTCPAATTLLTITFDSGTSPFFITSSNPQIIPNAGPINIAGLAVNAKAKTKAVAGSSYTLQPVVGSVVADKPITLTVSDSAGLSQDVVITVLNQPGLYVDSAAAAAEGDGSSINPFRTISSAVAASAGNETIDVAPGTYSNEAYPIVLKDGIHLRCHPGATIMASTTSESIIGPGAGRTADISGCLILCSWAGGAVIDSNNANLTVSNVSMHCQSDGTPAHVCSSGCTPGTAIRGTNNVRGSVIHDYMIGIDLYGGIVEGNTIINNFRGIWSNPSGVASYITSNLLEYNTDGIVILMSAPVVSNNTMRFNYSNGIDCVVTAERPLINLNSLYCNSEADLRVQGALTVIDATNNRWDHTIPTVDTDLPVNCRTGLILLGSDLCYDSAVTPAPNLATTQPPITTACPPGITK